MFAVLAIALDLLANQNSSNYPEISYIHSN